MQINDFLYHRTHPVATVADTSPSYLTLDPGDFDIFQISHTRNLILTAQIHQQRTMDGGKDHSLLQRRTNHRTLRQMDGQLLVAGHQDIRVECLAILPGIANRRHRITIVLNDGDQ